MFIFIHLNCHGIRCERQRKTLMEQGKRLNQKRRQKRTNNHTQISHSHWRASAGVSAGVTRIEMNKNVIVFKILTNLVRLQLSNRSHGLKLTLWTLNPVIRPQFLAGPHHLTCNIMLSLTVHVTNKAAFHLIRYQ